MVEPKKFITNDRPLTEKQVAQLSKIRVKDVKKAIADADRQLKALLEATKRF